MTDLRRNFYVFIIIMALKTSVDIEAFYARLLIQ